MQATIRWQGNVCFEAESGSGHKILIDGPPDHGGENRGPRPMETLLLGMGGCASFDVVQFCASRARTSPTAVARSRPNGPRMKCRRCSPVFICILSLPATT